MHCISMHYSMNCFFKHCLIRQWCYFQNPRSRVEPKLSTPLSCRLKASSLLLMSFALFAKSMCNLYSVLSPAFQKGKNPIFWINLTYRLPARMGGWPIMAGNGTTVWYMWLVEVPLQVGKYHLGLINKCCQWF